MKTQRNENDKKLFIDKPYFSDAFRGQLYTL